MHLYVTCVHCPQITCCQIEASVWLVQEEEGEAYLEALGSDVVKAADLARVTIVLERLPQ